MKTHQNHIHLFGNSEENFYVLGKKDKDAFSEIYQQISVLCARNSALAKIIKFGTEFSGQFVKRQPTQNLLDLKAYAEGLERDYQDVLFSLLLPEVVASFNKWVPNLVGVIPGCSSLFLWDEANQGVIHSRILDYALSGPFEKEERSILFDFSGRNKVFSYSTAGLPLPSLSGMNEHGLTLALHYKHGQYFNLEGDSIFLLASDILNYCTNIHEAIKLIKSKKSISYWGLYLSDANGEVASIDICGGEIYQEKFDIRDHDFLYFNNRPLLRKKENEILQPYGNLSQCQMRRDHVVENHSKIIKPNSKNLMVDSLKLLGKPSGKKSKTAKNWKLTPMTASSIQMFSLHNSLKSSILVPGEAPKFYLGNHIEYKNIFKNLNINEKENKRSQETPFVKGNRKLAKYQSSIDKAEISQAYHDIQMAIEYLKEYPDQYIAKFYFIVTQYISENDKRDLTYLYDDLKELDGKLPEYLEDHRLLFLMRLAKLIGHNVQNNSSKLKNEQLKKLYLKELKLKPLAIKGLKYLIFPRIEILDIIYAY